MSVAEARIERAIAAIEIAERCTVEEDFVVQLGRELGAAQAVDQRLVQFVGFRVLEMISPVRCASESASRSHRTAFHRRGRMPVP